MQISRDKKIFITGCGGMLGKAVYERFSPHCEVLATDIDLNEPWLEYGDVIDFQGIFFDGYFCFHSNKIGRASCRERV